MFGQRWLPRSERFGWAEAAIAAFALVAAVFIVLGEDTETSMFGLGFVGLVALRALGVPRRSLFALAVLLAALISAGLLGLLGGGSFGSTAVHVVVSGLLAWALAEPVWSRMEPRARPSRRVAVLVGVVLLVGVGWEIGELAAHSLLGTSLSVGFGETLVDLVADAFGALGGSLAAVRYGVQGGGAEPRRSPA
jgi:hypothetical protein